MALNDTFIKNSTKHSGKSAGDKHSDGGGLYLHVTASGKYWRMNYRMHGKQKTLALGIYPVVSLKEARAGRDKAKELLAKGVDPSTAKQEAKEAAKQAAANTYETLAREYHGLKAGGWSEAHAGKWLRMNELYLFPTLGAKAIAAIKAKDVLSALRKVETKGILSTAQDLQQMAGQVFRYAVQTGRIELNPVPDLKGALKPHVPKHFAAVIHPVVVGGFPGARTAKRPMSENTINAALKRMDFSTDEHVSHGFRAMARTMIAEQMQGIDPEIVEAQLAHGKSGALGSAYDRTEYIAQRREMMQLWADYLDKLRAGVGGSLK